MAQNFARVEHTLMSHFFPLILEPQEMRQDQRRLSAPFYRNTMFILFY